MSKRHPLHPTQLCDLCRSRRNPTGSSGGHCLESICSLIENQEQSFPVFRNWIQTQFSVYDSHTVFVSHIQRPVALEPLVRQHQWPVDKDPALCSEGSPSLPSKNGDIMSSSWVCLNKVIYIKCPALGAFGKYATEPKETKFTPHRWVRWAESLGIQ